MPDGDEIDDIEEACVDDDSPPPKVKLLNRGLRRTR
jgi:hypothetical protein